MAMNTVLSAFGRWKQEFKASYDDMKAFLEKESYFKTSKQNKNRTKHQPTNLETSIYPERRCEISIMRLSNRIQLCIKHDRAGILVFFVALIEP